MGDTTELDAAERSNSLSWWAIAEPDTLTLGDYHRLRAEADAEDKTQRRRKLRG